jgi:hypothetical protein
MKTLNISFTNREFAELKRAKKMFDGHDPWHNFIMRVVRRYVKDGKF